MICHIIWYKEYEIIKRQRAVEKLDEQPHIEKITPSENTKKRDHALRKHAKYHALSTSSRTSRDHALRKHNSTRKREYARITLPLMSQIGLSRYKAFPVVRGCPLQGVYLLSGISPFKGLPFMQDFPLQWISLYKGFSLTRDFLL